MKPWKSRSITRLVASWSRNQPTDIAEEAEKEETDEARDDGKPRAPGLSGEKPFPNIQDAPNPEKLAGNEHYEKG